MSPVAVSADRRFHRAHVKPARTRGRVRRALRPLAKYAVAVAVAAAAVYGGVRALAGSTALRIDRIVVRGNARISSEQIRSMLGELRGQNIVLTSLEHGRAALLLSPWVRDATLRRSRPSTIEVAVSEREPLGVGRFDGRLFLVDERGSVIDEFGPQYTEFDLPIIDGLGALANSAAADHERGELAARVIRALRAKPAIAKRLSQVDVTDVHNAAVIVDEDPALIYVGEDRFLARLESYLGLAPALRGRVPDIDYVDLRVDDRIFVRPTARARAGAINPPPVGGRAGATQTSGKKHQGTGSGG